MVGRICRTLAIAYHKPSVPTERKRVEKLAQLVSETLETRVETLLLEEVGKKPDAMIALLLFTRGGHWHSVVTRSCKAEIIPQTVTAAAIAREAQRKGATTIVVVIHRARRLVEEQYSDAKKIESLLDKIGFKTQLVFLESLTSQAKYPISVEKPCIVAPLALLRGKLVSKASHLALETGCINIGSFIEYGFWDLYTWLVSFFSSTTVT